WRLPLAASVASSAPGQLLSGDPRGANLAGRFIVPADARLGGGQIAGKGEYFVVLSLQEGKAPDVKVEGSGLDAKVTVGARTIAFDGRRISLGK
ncbi:MAG: hypothetical protein ABR915_24040, partial [Thermoguttaceae bacterium]